MGCNISFYTNTNVTYVCDDVMLLCPLNLDSTSIVTQSGYNRKLGTDDDVTTSSSEDNSQQKNKYNPSQVSFGSIFTSLKNELIVVNSNTSFSTKPQPIVIIVASILGAIILGTIFFCCWDQQESRSGFFSKKQNSDKIHPNFADYVSNSVDGTPRFENKPLFRTKDSEHKHSFDSVDDWKYRQGSNQNNRNSSETKQNSPQQPLPPPPRQNTIRPGSMVILDEVYGSPSNSDVVVNEPGTDMAMYSPANPLFRSRSNSKQNSPRNKNMNSSLKQSSSKVDADLFKNLPSLKLVEGYLIEVMPKWIFVHDHLLVTILHALFTTHKYIAMFSRSSISNTRLIRFFNLCQSVVVLLFVNTVFFSIAYPDDGTCEGLKSKSNCNLYQSRVTKENICSWNGSDDTCFFKQLKWDFQYTILLSMLTILVSVPFQMLFHQLNHKICRKRPNLTLFGLSNDEWLGEIPENNNVEMEEAIHQIRETLIQRESQTYEMLNVNSEGELRNNSLLTVYDLDSGSVQEETSFLHQKADSYNFDNLEKKRLLSKISSFQRFGLINSQVNQKNKSIFSRLFDLFIETEIEAHIVSARRSTQLIKNKMLSTAHPYFREAILIQSFIRGILMKQFSYKRSLIF
jgi:hypothetical protein